MRFEGWQRKAVALALLVVLAGLVWQTIEAGKSREIALLLLGGFALRIVLARPQTRYDEDEVETAKSEDGRSG